MTLLKWHKTSYKGVRFREHETRRHGMQLDRYFSIRYQHNGKQREEGLGWQSEGWTAKKASFERAALQKAKTLGEGPASLEEKREIEKQRREKERQEKARLEKEGLTFGQFFTETYYPIAKTSKKRESYIKENEHFNTWLSPVIGNIPLSQLTHFHIEKLKKKMQDAGKAPRMVQYVFATMRQAWNMARKAGIVFNESPTKQVKVPKIDNRRMRFLSQEEAEALLKELLLWNTTVYNMAVLSLHTGMRAGEIFNLKWGCIDIDRGIINILDPKGNVTHSAYMTDQVKALFKKLRRKGPEDFIFTDKEGNKFKEIPSTFRTVVNKLGFNNGITDQRRKICFHSLRHSYASWLVEAGTDLYTVKELLGHCNITMTERYSHLGQNTLQGAVKNLERTMKKEQEAKTQEGKA
jgi:integrase